MVNKNLVTHDGSLFTWLGNEGSIEVSDLGKLQFYGQVFDDAADVGFFIRSHRTGTKKLFIGHAEFFAGELTHWTFTEYDPRTRQMGRSRSPSSTTEEKQ